MKYVYRTQGTCSTNIELDVENGILKEVAYWGGCNGNLQGVSRLVKGMKVEEVITRLEGIRCSGRPTSCPDQFYAKHCTKWDIEINIASNKKRRHYFFSASVFIG